MKPCVLNTKGFPRYIRLWHFHFKRLAVHFNVFILALWWCKDYQHNALYWDLGYESPLVTPLLSQDNALYWDLGYESPLVTPLLSQGS